MVIFRRPRQLLLGGVRYCGGYPVYVLHKRLLLTVVKTNNLNWIIHIQSVF